MTSSTTLIISLTLPVLMADCISVIGCHRVYTTNNDVQKQQLAIIRARRWVTPLIYLTGYNHRRHMTVARSFHRAVEPKR